MTDAGYSSKPLVEKLGYEPGDSLYSINMPAELVDYFTNCGVVHTNATEATWLHAFFISQQALDDFAQNTSFDTIEKGLWLSWPKRASNVPTDLTEQSFRDTLLPMGWVDTKVAAIDQTWSGLKFLRRRV